MSDNLWTDSFCDVNDRSRLRQVDAGSEAEGLRDQGFVGHRPGVVDHPRARDKTRTGPAPYVTAIAGLATVAVIFAAPVAPPKGDRMMGSGSV
jgi:hypothetical protein